MKIALIGHDAYLAQNLYKMFSSDIIEPFLRIEDFQKSCVKDFNVAINFTIQPEFNSKILSKEELLDVKLAQYLKDTQTNLVMISSRKVYGSQNSLVPIKEDFPLRPIDFYSKNKVTAEKYIQNILPERTLIVRVANILAEPVNRIGYKTFMGWISENILIKNKLIVTENSKTKKDFITRDYFQKALALLIHKRVQGTINIGAGFAFSLKDLLTEIVGKENIFFEEKFPIRDSFILSTDKLHKFVPPFLPEELHIKCQTNQKILANYIKIQTEKTHGKG